MVCELAFNALTQLGYEVLTVTNGEDAILRYKEAMDAQIPIDLIIMDLTVSRGMGGKETVQEILKIHSDAKVVVSSGNSTDPVVANFKEYGFVAAFKKPFEISLLSKVVHSLLM